MLYNVQSISDNGFLIRDIVDEENVDIAFITETWISENDNVKIESIRLNSFGRPVSFPRITGGPAAEVEASQS